MDFHTVIEVAVRIVESAGVAVIVVGAVLASVLALRHLLRREERVYERFRRFLGRSILLGLELLVAADIVRTVTVSFTIESVGSLAVIVVIRTFLSWSLELEISGRWPWQKHGPEQELHARADTEPDGVG
ncbi:DUF1622 domain-containing protein [Salinibacterium sp. SYSU T00001]|uniref:DUF1622 domain-containing protein n=1 Tax=Homoserinimonas sedimenticola TaxID=2986805 RepID=UPI002236998C|nr:DUF1622 domain-containing protein [Salinibacterium sedimenticola]MCW4385684.1 DUF1622 domain-containing protein [Salinibacterium sedimenticola]